MRILKALLALGAIGALVLGAPLALTRLGRIDALARIDWRRVLVTPDDGSLLLGLLTVVGWVAWLLIVASLVSEVVAVATSGRFRLRLPGTAWFRPASTALLASLTGLGVAAVVAPVAPVTAAATPSAAVSASTTDSASDAPAAVTLQARIAPANNLATHTVAPGDDLWSLAVRYLGDGSRWREIVAANDTLLLDATAELRAGTVLQVPVETPAAAQVAEPAEPTDGASSVTVAEGDTLWALSDRHLGDPERWPELAASNQDQIRDPDLLQPGWELRLPGSLAAAPSAASADQPASNSAPATADAATSDGPNVVAAPVGPSGSAAHPDSVDRQESVDHQDSVVSDASDAGDPAAIAEVQAQIRDILGPIGAGLAASVLGGVLLRRRLQLGERPLGRRLLGLSPDATQFETALDRLGALSQDQRGASTTHVVLGIADGAPLLFDLATATVTVVEGSPDDTAGLLASIALQLWGRAEEELKPEIILAGQSLHWLAAVDDPDVTATDVPQGMALVSRLVQDRQQALGNSLAQLRSSPDTSEAWRPLVALFDRPPAAEPLGYLQPELSATGVCIVVAAEDSTLLGSASHAVRADVEALVRPTPGQVITLGDEEAWLRHGPRFEAQLVLPPARRALQELLTTTNATEYDHAPWWDDDPAPPGDHVRPNQPTPEPRKEAAVEPTFATSTHPRLLLLGPVELTATRGEDPTRARKQCEEYCAWILQHPGATATQMTRSLLVAETTRRSNMSRLRSWLGSTPAGEPYLPDAYSGHIGLHPAVSSDWEQLNVLISGGVNRATDSALRQALELVRGAPLADAAPGMWHWAEELRTDMASTVRDIGVVLGRRALAVRDLDLARWAASRALVAAPEDDLLMMLRIQTENAAGHRAEVERLVLHVTRQARLLGVDLADDMVTLLQEVMEGAARARSAV